MFRKFFNKIGKKALGFVKGIVKKAFEDDGSILKKYGKQAIGYVRGLNGDKAATLLAAATSSMLPYAAPIAVAGIKPVGFMINQGLDWIQNDLLAKNKNEENLLPSTPYLMKKRPTPENDFMRRPRRRASEDLSKYINYN